MDISKRYDGRQIEDKWYAYWMQQGFFKSVPDGRPAYTIVIPPPNVTGVLHMGHMLNNTIQDVLTRRARMQGKNACWVPGTDHASIATESKVVAMLREKKIKKSDLSREDFLKHAWEWKEKHGGIILEQLKKLGASCDWDRTGFTMDTAYYDAVIQVFIDLYNKGYIYRGLRMINWDPQAKTALSDEEVIHKEVQSKLYYVKYKIEGSKDEWITIATTRPETILGDTAICVNPKDKRFQHYKGKKALVPLINRSIPIIFDPYVDMEFGTGALKVTPAHDVNDYELGIKHQLETIDIMNSDGTLNEHAQLYIGEDRFAARKKIIKDIEREACLVKVEDMVNSVGFSERTDAVIEPRLSLQWFCSMKELAEPALKNIMSDNIKIYPAKFKNTYKHWMENIRDWCISRQLWWGQRIPAYYYGEGDNDYVIAKTEEEALQLAREKTQNASLKAGNLKQDEDVLDTWFSSWLWPIAVFDGFKDLNNKELQYYYPTDTLVTAPEILFFWVARMIMAGYEYKNEKPFSNVYLTGIVRDQQGRKMSKSLGNSPEPLELIEKYGADGVRVGMLLCSPAGNDLLFDEKLCEQGRNFANKIWNAFRLIKGWEISEGKNEHNNFANNWFEFRLNRAYLKIEGAFKNFRISEVLKIIYSLIWDDFCSWYLEMIKPDYQKPIDQDTQDKAIDFFERLMKLLHPFMPFITEEIYHILKERDKDDCIIVAELSEITSKLSEVTLIDFKDIITNIRNIRGANNISHRELLPLFIKTAEKNNYVNLEHVIKKLAGIEKIEYVKNTIEDAKRFLVGTEEFFIPIEVDKADELEDIKKQLEYNKGFLSSVEKKLKNKRFVENAPQELVEREKKKLADAETKIKILEDSLEKLN